MGKLFGVEDPLSVAFGENFASAIPGYNALTGSKSDAQKNLEATQKRLAEEMKGHRTQQQNARMQGLTQQLGAFAPRNQMMGQVFGPQAAFSPQEMGNMVQNPLKPHLPPELFNYTGLDPAKRQQVQKYLDEMKQWEANNAERRGQVEAAFGGNRAPPPMNQPPPMQMAPPRRPVR